jgi:hypothetical protein
MPETTPLQDSVMAAHGYYGRHAQPQARAASAGYRWLTEAAGGVPLPDGGRPVVLADMGCADGRNAVRPLGLAIDGIRARDARVPVEVVHSDLPGNDFSALFALLAGPDGYLAGRPAVYPFAVGRTLYGPLLPDGRLHLGWCSITLHWLSSVPVAAPGGVFANLLPAGPAREALREQAAEDWRVFLGERARELVDGGELVLVGGASTPAGESGAEGLFRMVGDALAELGRAGVLRPAEAARIFYPTWNRTPEEWIAPLRSEGDLELLDAEMSATDDAAAYPQFAAEGNAEAFADAYLPFVRAITERSFFRWLDPDRSPEERAAIGTAFYTALRDRIAADPASATCRWQVMSLRLRRRPRRVRGNPPGR